MNWSPVWSFVEPIILFRSMSYRMANSKGLQVRAWWLHGHTTESLQLSEWKNRTKRFFAPSPMFMRSSSCRTKC
jgi:hypothetical protein